MRYRLGFLAQHCIAVKADDHKGVNAFVLPGKILGDKSSRHVIVVVDNDVKELTTVWVDSNDKEYVTKVAETIIRDSPVVYEPHQ